MPGFDRTGPSGFGPMTGGGRGRCRTAEFATGGFFQRGRRMGRGMGYGCGFGYGRGNRAGRAPYPVSAVDEVGRLKAEAELLKQDLDHLNRVISDLEGVQSKES